PVTFSKFRPRRLVRRIEVNQERQQTTIYLEPGPFSASQFMSIIGEHLRRYIGILSGPQAITLVKQLRAEEETLESRLLPDLGLVELDVRLEAQFATWTSQSTSLASAISTTPATSPGKILETWTTAETATVAALVGLKIP